MPRLLPRSLLGQMLLGVAVALLVAQGISAFLQFRETERRREMGALNGLAFQLVAEPRFEFRRTGQGAAGKDTKQRWQRLRVQRTREMPLRPGEERDTEREAQLRTILTEQGLEPTQLLMTSRVWGEDTYVMGRLRERFSNEELPQWARAEMLVAAVQRPGESEWTVARVPLSDREPRALGSLIAQTLLLYVLLVGGLAWLLRRITRPIAALTRRVEEFSATREIEGQLAPSGPDDTQLLITAHNAMEERIVALINEKDVMLGAIGHDLKTPLAALRVRIESVEDPAERAKMAASIEDITRSLDDILSLARVGRTTDPLERTDLSALVASVAEEYEDMGEPVELGDTRRLAVPLRANSMRRAVRNLIENAIRYGHRARVSLLSDNGQAVIRIEDDGPGIPVDDIGPLMEPFARGESSRNRVTGGSGLGLTLARAIAEQHGGTIALHNRTDGTGLVAEIRLPLG